MTSVADHFRGEAPYGYHARLGDEGNNGGRRRERTDADS